MGEFDFQFRLNCWVFPFAVAYTRDDDYYLPAHSLSLSAGPFHVVYFF